MDYRSVRSKVKVPENLDNLFLFLPAEEGDKQQAIYNAIDGSQTASFWGDSVISYINTSHSLGSVL